MKNLTIRQSVIGVNIFSGCVSIGIILGGFRLLNLQAIDRDILFVIGGLFTLIFSSIHAIFLTVWIVPALKTLKQKSALFDSAQDASQKQPTFRTREIQELAHTLNAEDVYLRDLIRAGENTLKNGAPFTIPPRSDTDILGKAFHEHFHLFQALERYVGDIARGDLKGAMPPELQTTTLWQKFRLMTLTIRRSLGNVRHEINRIAEVSAQVAAMSRQGVHNTAMEARAIEQISLSGHHVTESLHDVIEHITQQAASLDDTFTAITGMTSSIDEVNATITDLSSASKDMVHAVDEIHEFMQEIETHAQSSAEISGNVSAHAKDGLHAVAAVIEGINTIRDTVQEAAGAIQRLGSESGRIGEILAVINDVADQTSLLALNASIIAAQAGEHGRGFSVVAEEIKGLAERTQISTKEIAHIITSVQTEVAQGMTAMESCLVAVEQGVELANQSGTVLKKIVRGIQASKKMITTMASATVTQTRNSQQLQTVAQNISATLNTVYATIEQQADRSIQLVQVTQFLQELTQQIEHSAIMQLQEAEQVVQSIEAMNTLVKRNLCMANLLSDTSDELGNLESSLAEDIGRFYHPQRVLPATFDPKKPAIAVVYRSSLLFFQQICQGIQEVFSSTPLQLILLNSTMDPVHQASHMNWALQYPLLKGILLAPVDNQTTARLAAGISKKGLPLVTFDTYSSAAGLTVCSDNQQGGAYAAELLRDHLPDDSVVLICGFRSLSSVNSRMNGFFQQAETYRWQLIEYVTPVKKRELTKKSILEGLALTPDAQGIFLSSEPSVLAYLELFQEGKLHNYHLQAVGFDTTPEIVEAINDGRLVGTIAQNPFEIGRCAAQGLSRLLDEPMAVSSESSEKRLVPVSKVTRETLAAGSLVPQP